MHDGAKLSYSSADYFISIGTLSNQCISIRWDKARTLKLPCIKGKARPKQNHTWFEKEIGAFKYESHLISVPNVGSKVSSELTNGTLFKKFNLEISDIQGGPIVYSCKPDKSPKENPDEQIPKSPICYNVTLAGKLSRHSQNHFCD